MSHQKKALWLMRAGIWFVILAPVSFSMERLPEAPGNVALALVGSLSPPQLSALLWPWSGASKTLNRAVDRIR